MALAPYHDAELADDAVLIRRVNDLAVQPKPDGGAQVSKSCYSSSSAKVDEHRGCSCDLLELLTQNPAEEGWYPATKVVVGIKVGDARSIGADIRVGRDPVEGNPAHTSIWQVDAQGKGVELSLQRRRALLSKSFVVRPDDGSVTL